MTAEENLKNLNIELPKAADPVGSYVATKKSGNQLYVSGQISINKEGVLIKGKLGRELSVDEGYKAAERCALNIIAQVKKACNEDLSKVKKCIKITGFVNSTDDFNDQPKVINPASETLAAVFGDKGKHARAAISANALPLGAAVEIEAIFEID